MIMTGTTGTAGAGVTATTVMATTATIEVAGIVEHRTSGKLNHAVETAISTA